MNFHFLSAIEFPINPNLDLLSNYFNFLLSHIGMSKDEECVYLKILAVRDSIGEGRVSQAVQGDPKHVVTVFRNSCHNLIPFRVDMNDHHRREDLIVTTYATRYELDNAHTSFPRHLKICGIRSDIVPSPYHTTRIKKGTRPRTIVRDMFYMERAIDCIMSHIRKRNTYDYRKIDDLYDQFEKLFPDDSPFYRRGLSRMVIGRVVGCAIRETVIQYFIIDGLINGVGDVNLDLEYHLNRIKYPIMVHSRHLISGITASHQEIFRYQERIAGTMLGEEYRFSKAAREAYMINTHIRPLTSEAECVQILSDWIRPYPKPKRRVFTCFSSQERHHVYSLQL